MAEGFSIARGAEDQTRPWMLSLTIRDKNSLAAAYLPYVKGGGLFIPTNKTYDLGEAVFVMLTLAQDDTQRFPITGKVVWLSPAGMPLTRPQGIGIQFPADDEGRVVKTVIEQIIGNIHSTLKTTSTL
ncbi:MAG: PilZ domain-containing protein [Burkholderiaceae bacterium]|jgi:type IV pilus assembly protein PilZ